MSFTKFEEKILDLLDYQSNSLPINGLQLERAAGGHIGLQQYIMQAMAGTAPQIRTSQHVAAAVATETLVNNVESPYYTQEELQKIVKLALETGLFPPSQGIDVGVPLSQQYDPTTVSVDATDDFNDAVIDLFEGADFEDFLHGEIMDQSIAQIATAYHEYRVLG